MISQRDLDLVSQQVLEDLQNLYPLPQTGLVAGGAVVSVLLKRLNSPMTAPVNDIDVFIGTASKKQYSDTETNDDTLLNAKCLNVFIHKDPYNDKKTNAHQNVNIKSVEREGLLNNILFNTNGLSLTAGYRNILKSFDIDMVQVGIDIETGTLFTTDNFLTFLNTQKASVCNIVTPVKSYYRLIKKSLSCTNIDFNLNDEELKLLHFQKLIEERMPHLFTKGVSQETRQSIEQVLPHYIFKKDRYTYVLSSEHYAHLDPAFQIFLNDIADKTTEPLLYTLICSYSQDLYNCFYNKSIEDKAKLTKITTILQQTHQHKQTVGIEIINALDGIDSQLTHTSQMTTLYCFNEKLKGLAKRQFLQLFDQLHPFLQLHFLMDGHNNIRSFTTHQDLLLNKLDTTKKQSLANALFASSPTADGVAHFINTAFDNITDVQLFADMKRILKLFESQQDKNYIVQEVYHKYKNAPIQGRNNVCFSFTISSNGQNTYKNMNTYLYPYISGCFEHNVPMEDAFKELSRSEKWRFIMAETTYRHRQNNTKILELTPFIADYFASVTEEEFNLGKSGTRYNAYGYSDLFDIFTTYNTLVQTLFDLCQLNPSLKSFIHTLPPSNQNLKDLQLRLHLYDEVQAVSHTDNTFKKRKI